MNYSEHNEPESCKVIRTEIEGRLTHLQDTLETEPVDRDKVADALEDLFLLERFLKRLAEVCSLTALIPSLQPPTDRLPTSVECDPNLN